MVSCSSLEAVCLYCTAAEQHVAAKATPQHRAAVAACGEELRRRVLYRDDDMLVVDKPAGLPVQGGSSATLDPVMSIARTFDPLLRAL